MEFTVTEAEGYIEDGVAVLGMGAADEAGRSVMLQGSVGEVDQSERDAGWDTYHIAVDDDRSVYGGVTHCSVTRDRVRLSFGSAAAARLGTGELLLNLQLPQEQLQLVAGYLKTILTSGRESEHPQLSIIDL